MLIDTTAIAKEFSITEEELTRKSLRAFMLEQLRLLEAERKARCAKFGVKDLWEMEQLFVEGKVEGGRDAGRLPDRRLSHRQS